MEENIILDENTLSPWLKKDLKKFLDCKNSNVHPNWDLSLYWSELYSSINISQLSKEITKEQAEYLRRKYLGICWNNNRRDYGKPLVFLNGSRTDFIIDLGLSFFKKSQKFACF